MFRLRMDVVKTPRTFYKNARNYNYRSRQLEQLIVQQKATPDHVFHVFGMCVPGWDHLDIPFSMLIDSPWICAIGVCPLGNFRIGKSGVQRSNAAMKKQSYFYSRERCKTIHL